MTLPRGLALAAVVLLVLAAITAALAYWVRPRPVPPREYAARL
jgi:hypothetical protein